MIKVDRGWYLDPSGFNCERFWVGTGWTEHSRPVSVLQGY